MKRVNEIKVSKKGWSTTVFFEDGTKDVISFENFLKTFGDWRKAVLEYMTYIYVVGGTNHSVAEKAINEVKHKLLSCQNEGE